MHLRATAPPRSRLCKAVMVMGVGEFWPSCEPETRRGVMKLVGSGLSDSGEVWKVEENEGSRLHNPGM